MDQQSTFKASVASRAGSAAARVSNSLMVSSVPQDSRASATSCLSSRPRACAWKQSTCSPKCCVHEGSGTGNGEMYTCVRCLVCWALGKTEEVPAPTALLTAMESALGTPPGSPRGGLNRRVHLSLSGGRYGLYATERRHPKPAAHLRGPPLHATHQTGKQVVGSELTRPMIRK